MVNYKEVLILNTLLAALYFFLAAISVPLTDLISDVPLFWPSAGIAFVFVYARGPGSLPGIFVGHLLFSLVFASDSIFAKRGDIYDICTYAIFPAIACIQAYIGAYLCRKLIGVSARLESFFDIIKFAFLSGPVACLASAGLYALTLYGFHQGHAEPLHHMAFVYYLSNVLGVLIIGGFSVLFLSVYERSNARKANTAIPFFMAMCLIFVLLYGAKIQEKKEIKEILTDQAERSYFELNLSLEKYLQRAIALQHFFHSSEVVTEDEFKSFAGDSFLNDKSSFGFAWAPKVTDRKKYEKEYALIKDFKNQKNPRAVEMRDFYLPITYAVMQGGNPEYFVGFDFLSEDVRREAAMAAIASKEAVITGPIKLLSKGKEVAGGDVFIPVFDNKNVSSKDNADNVQGIIVMAFIYENLLSSFTEEWKDLGIEMRIVDVETQQNVFQSEGLSQKKENQRFLAKHGIAMNFAGRALNLEFYKSDEFLPEELQKNMRYVLMFSAVFMFLFSVFVLTVTGQTAFVESKVTQKTKELASRTRFLDIVMNSVPDLISVKDKNLNIIMANDALMEKYPEHLRNQVIGSDGLQRFAEDEAEFQQGQDQFALEEGQAQVLMQHSDYDGQVRNYMYKRVRFEDEEGAPYILCIAQDVTEVINVQKKLQTIMDSLGDGFITFNGRGEIETYNTASENIFGYTSEEVIGKNLMILLPEGFMDQTEESFEHFIDDFKALIGEGAQIGREFNARHKEGRIFPVHVSPAEMELGGKKYFSAVIRDITNQKAAEKELKRSNQELEDFAYVASHDLKAPLRHVSMSAEFLHDMYAAELDDKARDLLEIITGGTQRMQRMIDSLLSYSRVGRGEKDFEALNLYHVLDNTLNIISGLAQESDAQIKIHDLPIVQGDHYLMVQLFQNLMENSIKYRKPDTKPVIEVKVEEETSDTYIIGVRDNGIGIDPEYAEKVFKVFQRLHREDEVQGVGIGLAVCQRIVEFHGGKIWLDTSYADGCLFKFSLSKSMA